jgi:hypothetical protein
VTAAAAVPESARRQHVVKIREEGGPHRVDVEGLLTVPRKGDRIAVPGLGLCVAQEVITVVRDPKKCHTKVIVRPVDRAPTQPAPTLKEMVGMLETGVLSPSHQPSLAAQLFDLIGEWPDQDIKVILRIVDLGDDTDQPLGFPEVFLLPLTEVGVGSVSTRVDLALRNEGLQFLGELAALEEEALMRIPNLGKKSVDDICSFLEAKGVSGRAGGQIGEEHRVNWYRFLGAYGEARTKGFEEGLSAFYDRCCAAKSAK